MPTLSINWEDRDWEYDPEMIDIRRGRAIEEFCGRPLYGWESGVLQCDVRCLTALLWEIKKQNGEPTMPMKAMNFSPVAFHRAVLQAQADELDRQRQEAEDHPPVEDDDGDPTGTPTMGIPGPTLGETG